MLRSPQAIRRALLTRLTFFLVAASPAEVPTPVRELDVQGYHVRLDLSRQVLGIEIPDDRVYGERGVVETPIALDPPNGPRACSSRARCSPRRAKQFDDGLYAAVERAAQDGAGNFRARPRCSSRWPKRLRHSEPAEDDGEPRRPSSRRPADLEVAGRRSTRGRVGRPGRHRARVPQRSAPLEADRRASTWSPALESIFRQDRMLQSEFKGKTGIESVARGAPCQPRGRVPRTSRTSLLSRG